MNNGSHTPGFVNLIFAKATILTMLFFQHAAVAIIAKEIVI